MAAMSMNGKVVGGGGDASSGGDMSSSFANGFVAGSFIGQPQQRFASAAIPANAAMGADEAERKEEWKKWLMTNDDLIQYTIGDCVIPELGVPKKGKIRDIYFTEDKVLMVTSDRVSAFDSILPNLIPFKGAILCAITRHALAATRDIVPNAMVDDCEPATVGGVSTSDPNVIVQKRMRNLQVEFIVRGYLWGSMANAFEKGDRVFCGLRMPEGLLRYQRLPTPILTPTTKGIDRDENLTFEEVEERLGKEMAHKARDAALRLYERGVEEAKKGGLLLIDTKYEFGLDDHNVLHVIDEVNTPDSSRMCRLKDWEAAWLKVEAEMAATLPNGKPKYANVTELLAEKPSLKIREYSKQYVRDLLVEQGYRPHSLAGGRSPPAPQLTREQVAECVCRYVMVFERLTGQRWRFPSVAVPPAHRLVQNLRSSGVIAGCCVPIFGGSDSDLAHLQKIETALKNAGIPAHIRICSAHKQPQKLGELLNFYNQSIEPLMVVACAGLTDALSGVASYHSLFPVVTCPPDGLNHSSLENPTGSSNAFIKRPDNVAKFAMQMFGVHCPAVRQNLATAIKSKVEQLDIADRYY